MNKFGRRILFLVIPMFLVACSIQSSKTFTITGKYVQIASDMDWGASTEGSVDPQKLNLAEANVIVTYESTDENGEIEYIELATGTFSDGEAVITGTIDKPVSVKISVDLDDNKVPLSVETTLDSEYEVEFALLDYDADYLTDKLVLVGASRAATDPSTKFSISGTLTSLPMGSDLETTTVIARVSQYNEEGASSTFDFGNVLLKNGSFLIEADAHEPTVVDVLLDAGQFITFGAFAVVEPGSEITVVQRGANNRLFATSGTGLHAKLIESWQESDEFDSAFKAYEIAYAEFQAQQRAEQESSQSETVEKALVNQDASNEEELETDSNKDVVAEDPAESTKVEIVDAESSETDDDVIEDETTPSAVTVESNLADGCEHVDLSEVEQDDIYGLRLEPSFEVREYQKYQDIMSDLETNALEDFARNVEEPMNSLLALELGAFVYSDDTEAVRLFDELALRLNSDLVARRVVPAKNQILRRVEFAENQKNVAPGQKAPTFVLADMNGNEVVLYDVIAKNELVFLDFWASWCGPCIGSFPKLKELYSAYTDDGFEIVSVAIDDTSEDWEQASDEQELPWVNLGENKGWEGLTAHTYGVNFIPKSFLIDREGCIIQKDLQSSKLEELLVARYGGIADSEEPQQIED